MNELPNPINPTLPDPAQENYKHKRDFWLGVIVCIVVNVAVGISIFAVPWLVDTLNLPSEWESITLPGLTLLNCFPWVFNFGAIVLALVLRRPWIALGFLAVFSVGFFLTLIAYALLAAWCFFAMMQGTW